MPCEQRFLVATGVHTKMRHEYDEEEEETRRMGKAFLHGAAQPGSILQWGGGLPLHDQVPLPTFLGTDRSNKKNETEEL